MAASCVVSDGFAVDYPVDLTVSQNALSLSGEGFTISDSDNNVIFRMDGHALSIRDRCTLLDAEGNPILTARKNLVSIHERWQVARGGDFEEENLILSVRKSSLLQFRTHLEVFLNDEDREADYEVKGNFFSREVDIYNKDGDKIAELKRKHSLGDTLLDKHTFTVSVEPNVDQAFIATLVIIMDRIHED